MNSEFFLSIQLEEHFLSKITFILKTVIFVTEPVAVQSSRTYTLRMVAEVPYL